jgi:hypothetical protein
MAYHRYPDNLCRISAKPVMGSPMAGIALPPRRAMALARRRPDPGGGTVPGSDREWR